MSSNTQIVINPVIKVKDLSKSFGEKIVLSNISLSVSKGENLIVLGKSGSGKSVLIKCLVGLLKVDEGEIIINDINLSNLDDSALNNLRQKVGFLFQSGALYDSMSVYENLAFPLRQQKEQTKAQKDDLIKEALSNVGLADVIDKMPSELSGGMRKRLGLARTLILKPEIILYDEPTTGLDPITSNEISELINSIQKTLNTTAIIITHDMACAHTTANRMLVLNEGKIITEGTYEELSKSEDKLVAAFFKL